MESSQTSENTRRDKKAVKKAILKQLEEYGDHILGSDEKLKKGRKRPSSATGVGPKKKKKKKKKKQLDQDDPSTKFTEPDIEKEVLTGAQKHLQDLKEKLGLTEAEIARLKALKGGSEKSGKSSQNGKKKQRPEAEIIVFEDPAKRRERREALGLGPKELPFKLRKPVKSKPIGAEPVEFNIHKARHDVVQFGIKGSDSTTRAEAEIALAVQLGAKPPKKKQINYKEFQEMRKKAKEEERQKRELDRQLGFKVSNPNKQPRARRGGKSGLKFVDGQVGQYKRGVQVLTSQEIDRVKKGRIQKH